MLVLVTTAGPLLPLGRQAKTLKPFTARLWWVYPGLTTLWSAAWSLRMQINFQYTVVQICLCAFFTFVFLVIFPHGHNYSSRKLEKLFNKAIMICPISKKKTGLLYYHSSLHPLSSLHTPKTQTANSTVSFLNTNIPTLIGNALNISVSVKQSDRERLL